MPTTIAINMGMDTHITTTTVMGMVMKGIKMIKFFEQILDQANSSTKLNPIISMINSFLF